MVTRRMFVVSIFGHDSQFILGFVGVEINDDIVIHGGYTCFQFVQAVLRRLNLEGASRACGCWRGVCYCPYFVQGVC